MSYKLWTKKSKHKRSSDFPEPCHRLPTSFWSLQSYNIHLIIPYFFPLGIVTFPLPFIFSPYCDSVVFLVNIYLEANTLGPHSWQTDFLLKKKKKERKNKKGITKSHRWKSSLICTEHIRLPHRYYTYTYINIKNDWKLVWKKQLAMLIFINSCQPPWLLIVYQDSLWCLCRLWAVIQAETGWRCWCLRNRFRLLPWWGCDHSLALSDNVADIAVTHIIFPAANPSQEMEGKKSDLIHSVLSRNGSFLCFTLSQISRQPDFHRKILVFL